MAEDQQVGPGLYVKFGIDFSQMVGAGGAAAIVLNQSLQLFQQFERYGQQAFDATIQKAFEYQDVIEDLHNTLGITNADAQKWKSTLVSFDTDIGSFSSSLRYLTMRISDNTNSGDSLRATLKGIGVDAKDASGEYKNASDLIQEILIGLEKVPAGTERASKAAEIFGRNWYNMTDLINDGTAAVQTFKAQQPLFSDDELDRIDKAKTKMGEFQQKMDAIGAKTGASLLENRGISILLDYLSGSGQFSATNRDNYVAYQTAWEQGYKGSFDEFVAGSKIKGGADYGNTLLKTTSSNVVDLTDKYAGLTDAQIELIKTENLLTVAEKNRAAATNQTDYDKYSAEIQGYKNRIEELATSIAKVTTATKSATSSAAQWSASSVVGSAGSEMQLFLQREMELGTSYNDALTNWTHGAPTRGGAAAGTLGAVTTKKTVTPGSKEETKSTSTEFTTQETAAEKHYKSMQKMVSDYNTALLELYIGQEQASLTHWTAITELMRISEENMSQGWKKYVTFAAEYPTIHNIGIVTWTKTGPDWTPESNPVFMQTARMASLASQDLAYKSADFSAVKLSSSGSAGITIEYNQTVNGVDENTASTKVKNATTNGMSRALAGVTALGGQL